MTWKKACTNACHYNLPGFRDRSQTLVNGAWCKKGALEFFDPRKGTLKKITTNFLSRNGVYMLFYGVDPLFSLQRGGPWFFFDLKGGGAKNLASGPLLKCLWTVPYPSRVLWDQGRSFLGLFFLHSEYWVCCGWISK